jgi:DNA modification methylase
MESKNEYVLNDPVDNKLYVNGLFNIPLAPDRESIVRDKFFIPPFSVIDASKRWWLDRRDMWHQLGFDSTAGRPENMIGFSKNSNDSAGNIPIGRFDPVLCEVVYRWWCPNGGIILDPFCGGSVRGIVAEILGNSYIGMDLREEQTTENLRQAHELNLNPTYYVGDSRYFADIVNVEGDFIFSSPPYFWREHYSDLKEDLSNSKNYAEFLEGYRQAIKSVVSRLKNDRFACFEVAETRDPKTGFAQNFVGDTITAFMDTGMHLYNHGIHLKSFASAPTRANKIFGAHLKLVPIHENILVFVKGDPNKAAEICKNNKDYRILYEKDEISEPTTHPTERIEPVAPVGLVTVDAGPVPPVEPVALVTVDVGPITVAPPVRPVGPVAPATVGAGHIEPVVLIPKTNQPSTSEITTVTAAPPTVALAPRGARRAATSATPRPAATAFTEDPFLAYHAHRLATAGRGRLIFDAAEWDHSARTSVGLDVEVYPNFFLVCFKRFSDGRRLAFEMSSRSEFDVESVRGVMASNTTVSFNGLNYDLPIITAALDGADVMSIFELSQAIIKRNERQPWSDREWSHVDLFEVNPSARMGLKMLHGRLHGRWMVDLPFPPEESLTPEQMNIVTLYCMNDLDATEDLRTALLGPLEMRAELGRRYGMNLLSKSDAQVGEAIVRARLGGRVGRPNPQGGSFGYTPPSFLIFRGAEPRAILAKIAEEKFDVDPGGHVTASSWMTELEITINATTYSMGIGGLHSTESHRALFSDDERFLLDVDASSQYPNIIIGLGAMGLYPAATGPNFTTVYAEMVRERLEAKAAGDKVKADGLKIATNGVFGKLASSYSFLYAPDLMLATTLTGQLSLLMLAEAAEEIGVHVVSANTDGLTFYCPRNRESDLNEVLETWERDVGMTLERTRYSALYSRDVNTYLAIKEGGGVKRKGWIANPWADGDLRGMMQKNPQMTILSDAVVAHLTEGTPLETTINAANDPRAFITVIQAKGGASWRGRRLGRVVRYYWSTDGEPVVYTDSGRRVAKTEGARPMMELTDRLPNDLDRARYVAEATTLLADLGVGSNLISGR